MRGSNISFRQLKALVALAEHKNFSRAAETCHLSQSAFSAQIQMLEQQVRAKLFDRTTRSVELTAAGRHVERWARRALLDLDIAATDLENYLSIQAGRVSIAASPSLTASWLPPIVAGFHAAHPNVHLQIFDTLPDECIDLLRSERADFVLTSAIDIEADLMSVPLLEDPFCVVCRSDHPLAERAALRLEDIRGHRFVHLLRSSSTRQQIESALEALGTSVFIEVEHLASLIGLVTVGLGITILPSFSVARFRGPEVIAIPLAEPELCRSFSVIQWRGKTLSPSASEMLRSILAHRQQLHSAAAQR